MNEQRAFTVVVTGCKNCPCVRIPYGDKLCGHPEIDGSLQLYEDYYRHNKHAITPTCPMWNEAKPLEELK
jgi:hypothetical protein